MKEMFYFPLGSPNQRFLSISFVLFYVFKLFHFPFSFKLQIGLSYTSFNILKNLQSQHKKTLQLGSRGILDFLGLKVFLSLLSSSRKCFLHIGFFSHENLLGLKTHWVWRLFKLCCLGFKAWQISPSSQCFNLMVLSLVNHIHEPLSFDHQLLYRVNIIKQPSVS